MGAEVGLVSPDPQKYFAGWRCGGWVGEEVYLRIIISVERRKNMIGR